MRSRVRLHLLLTANAGLLTCLATAGKLTVLGNMLEELRAVGEEKIVVVSNFTTTLDLIETHCKRHKYPYQRLDG